MKKVKVYMITEAVSTINLEKQVQSNMEVGMQPFGSPFVAFEETKDDNGNTKQVQKFCQAMVTYEE